MQQPQKSNTAGSSYAGAFDAHICQTHGKNSVHSFNLEKMVRQTHSATGHMEWQPYSVIFHLHHLSTCCGYRSIYICISTATGLLGGHSGLIFALLYMGSGACGAGKCWNRGGALGPGAQ